MCAAAMFWPGGQLLFYMFKAHGGGVAPAVLPTLIPPQEEAVTCTWRHMIVNTHNNNNYNDTQLLHDIF